MTKKISFQKQLRATSGHKPCGLLLPIPRGPGALALHTHQPTAYSLQPTAHSQQPIGIV
jgi:hypothetical protein